MVNTEGNSEPEPKSTGHLAWVRISHWVLSISILALAVTGFVILQAHPRLYWGEVGNALTPALLELPISRNHQHPGWEQTVAFAPGSTAVTANRTYDIFNENGWARSLHFLAAWLVTLPGAFYLIGGAVSGHFGRHLVPRLRELTPRLVWQDLVRHLRLQIPAATGGPDYGLLQKCTYCVVVFVVVPLMVTTGLAMSPRITAAYPFLSSVFGGFQSARTLHFFSAVIVVLFSITHLAMVVRSGFRQQMRGMTVGH